MKKIKLSLFLITVVLIGIGCTSEDKPSDSKSPDLSTPHSVITSADIVYLHEIS